MPSLKRTLGLFDATCLTLGAIIGGGIFAVLGPAARVAGKGLSLSVLLAGIAAAIVASSVAALVDRFPREGGEYAFARETLPRSLAFLSGWAWCLDKMVATPVIALAFTSYMHAFLPGLPARSLAAGVIVAVTLINATGVRTAGTALDIMVVIKVGILALFIACGLPALAHTPSLLAHAAPAGGVLAGAALMFFAYVGLARPIYLVEEIVDPKRAVPRAIWGGLGISSAIYLLTAAVALAAVGPERLAASGSPIAVAAAGLAGHWLVVAVTLGALVATFSVVLDDNLGLSRMLLAMARGGDLPAWLKPIEARTQVPRRAILLVGSLTVGLTLLFNFEPLLRVASALILFYFGLVHLSAMRLDRGGWLRCRAIPGFGILVNAALLASLPWRSLAIAAATLLAGLAAHFLASARGSRRKR